LLNGAYLFVAAVRPRANGYHKSHGPTLNRPLTANCGDDAQKKRLPSDIAAAKEPKVLRD